jgi:F-type H+-transporting ATPase subunit alpha
MLVEEQVVSIWAIANGFMDDIPVSDVGRFEREMHEFLRDKHAEVYQHIKEQGTLPEDVEEQLREALGEFGKVFAPSSGPEAPKEAEADELEGEEGQETMKKVRKVPPKKEG